MSILSNFVTEIVMHYENQVLVNRRLLYKFFIIFYNSFRYLSKI